MPEHLAPGVFIEAVRPGRGPIVSAGTSTTAFVGPTGRGPLQSPTVVGSFSEYQTIFGPALRESLLSISVLHYFSNGGRTAVVVSTGHAGKRESGRASSADLIGDANAETGIYALDKLPANQPRANILVVPDCVLLSRREHASMIASALALCERNRMFLIIDPPTPRSTRRAVDTVLDWAKRSDSSRHPNAAVYFPRLECADPSNRSVSMLAPSSGAIAGIYARTDQREGVWKAPAGPDARLLGISDLELSLTDTQMNRLQDAAINSIRPFPRRGLLAWGARAFVTGPDDAEWKYVNVRRLALFIEESLYRGLDWAVFEQNGDALWGQIRLSVSSFMNHLWRKGALLGPSSRDAYLVKCDRETMTQADIDSGRVLALVGFAPLKPAEFIILKIELSAAHAT